MMFESEYSTGVYLMTAGNEMVGALLVIFSDGGNLGTVAALCVVNLVLVGIGLVAAMQFRLKIHA